MGPDARRPKAAAGAGGSGTPPAAASASDLLQQLRALNQGRGSSKTYAGLAAAGRSSALGQAGTGRRRGSPTPGVRVGSASGGGKDTPPSAYFLRQGVAEPAVQFATAHQRQQGTPAAFSVTPPSRPSARVATPGSGASPFADDELLMFHMTGLPQRTSSRTEGRPAEPQAARQQRPSQAQQRRGLHRTESAPAADAAATAAAPAAGASPPLGRAFSFAGEPSPRLHAVPLPTAMRGAAAGGPEAAGNGRARHATTAGQAEVPREAGAAAGRAPIDPAASFSAHSSPPSAGAAAELLEEAGSEGAGGAEQQPPLGPAWPQELLEWMLREKAGLMVEAQRAQRREQELCAELDRLRAQGSGAQREVQRLAAERRALLDRVQALSAAEAEAAARAERLAMENDALAAELRHSQEVCREMLAARRAARDALTEMSGQNASLLAAYVEMKQEAGRLQQALHQQQHSSEARIKQLEAQLAAAHTGSYTKPSSPTVHPLSGGSSPTWGAAEQLGSPVPAVASSFGHEHQRQQQEDAEDSGLSEAGAAGSVSGSPQPNKENEADNSGASAARRARQADKGRWEEERSELLTLLERLQDQLSARAGQQQTSAASPSPCRRGITPERGGHGGDGRRAPPPSPWAAAAAASNLEASFDSVSGSGGAAEGGWPAGACSPSAGSSGSSGTAMPADDDSASSPAMAAHLVEESPLPPHSWSRSGAPSPPSMRRAVPGAAAAADVLGGEDCAATSAGQAAAAEQGEEQVLRGGTPIEGRHTMEAFLGASPPAGNGSSDMLPGSAMQAAAAEQQGQQREELLAKAQQRAAELEAELGRLRLANAAAEERAAREERRRGAEAAKAAGNAAFQAQRYEVAVRHYSRGLEAVVAVPAAGDGGGNSDAGDDAALRAVLLCNRAAAQHACGRYLEALADCYRAVELDPGYARAYHRRADAYWELGVYDAAAQDLAHLTKLGAGQEVAGRLGDAQRRAQAAQPPNYYAVLGVKPAATPGELRAAYRALALRFHPDRAAAELGGEAAHAIFKLVSEAHRVLSDAEQRRHHDIAALRHKYRRFYAL